MGSFLQLKMIKINQFSVNYLPVIKKQDIYCLPYIYFNELQQKDSSSPRTPHHSNLGPTPRLQLRHQSHRSHPDRYSSQHPGKLSAVAATSSAASRQLNYPVQVTAFSVPPSGFRITACISTFIQPSANTTTG